MKCDNCINSRGIISENGIHQSCCLSPKQAIDCITGKKDQQITVFVVEENKDERDSN